MENSMSRMMVEIVVRKALKSIKDDPERSIRNLVDMAFHFSSEHRFPNDFFSDAQTMLQNENSAYYAMIRDLVTYTNTDRLFTFGMNLGYNGCTEGAKRLRSHEERMNCNIPWTISVQINTEKCEEALEKYHALICEGENLGIYTWMLFALNKPQTALVLAKAHPDSAFCIFCEADDLTAAFLDKTAELYNVMLVIRFEENAAKLCATLRNDGLLYSVWHQYGSKDVEAITNGDLFSSTQKLSPLFTVLIPDEHCPEDVRHLAYLAVKQVRKDQVYRTLAWEFQGDNDLIDSIISGDTCSVYFDQNGNLCNRRKTLTSKKQNLFQRSLYDILTSSYPKEKSESV